MDNSGDDAFSVVDALPRSDANSDRYDENDEMVLLQIIERSREAISPDLRALLDDRADIGWPSGQRQQSPLLLERPLSPAKDTPTFSFAKPAQIGKPFSLLPNARPNSVAMAPGRPVANGNEYITSNTDQEQDNQTSATCSHTEITEHPTSSLGVESSPKSLEGQGSTIQSSLSVPLENIPTLHNKTAMDCQTRQIQPSDLRPQPVEQRSPPEHEIQGVGCSILPEIDRGHFPDEPNSGELMNNERLSFEHLLLEGNRLPSMCSPNDQSRVMKQRHSNKRKSTKRLSFAHDQKSSQVPEEVLFEQLISRLRAREESEIVASHLQKEMEANMASLIEENKSLSEDLRTTSSKLCQKATEVKTYRAQTESWKSKLAKIKVFLNELGTDYQSLRGEAIHFKATRKSMDKERKEIMENIAAVKVQMLQISETSLDSRGCLSESEALIASLSQELNHAGERAQFTHNQLADEKKRSRLLELYIQNCSRAQDRKLDRVKTGQLEVMKTLESALEATAKRYESTNTVINDTFEMKVEELVSLVRSTTESLVCDKMDVQQCKETLSKFESCMELTTCKLSKDFENNSRIAEETSKGLELQLKGLKDSVSEESTLLKQLSASENWCNHLEKKLEETVPACQSLSIQIDNLREREIDLRQQMGNLGTSLLEVKLPERFGDDYFHISEKLGLENEIQQLSSRLKQTEKELDAQLLDTKEARNELVKKTARIHQAELKATKFESKNSGLQEKFKLAESKSRQDLDIAVQRCRDECKADFEPRLERLSKQKADTESEMQQTKELLVETQHKLGYAEDSLRVQRRDLENLLSEREMRIADLETSRTGCTSSLAKQAVEIERMREREAALMVQQTSLQSHLDEANRRSASAESELQKATTENQQSLQSLQCLEDRLSSLRADLGSEEEKRQALSIELGNANDSITSLQAELVEREEQNLALKKELEGGNSALVSLQADLVRKEGDRQNLSNEFRDTNHALSALQAELARKEEAQQALIGEIKDANESLSSIKCEIVKKEWERQAFSNEVEEVKQALSSVEARLVTKEEERQALNQELDDAKTARTGLEANKSKAKAEIHALLKRVQDSESCVRKVQEILDRANIAQMNQSFSESLDQLEVVLQSANENQQQNMSQIQSQVRTPVTSARNESSRPGPGVKSLEDGAQLGGQIIESKTPVNHATESPSKQPRMIVPFSSILCGLSPTQFPTTRTESFDLSCMLAQTPERISLREKATVLARPEKDYPFTEKTIQSMAREADGSPGIHRPTSPKKNNSVSIEGQGHASVTAEKDVFKTKGPLTGRKVSFVARKLTAEADDLQVPDSQGNGDQTNTLDASLARDNPIHTNRWTYSKRRRDTSTKEQEIVPSSSQMEQHQPQSKQGTSKKAKISSTSSTLTAQARTGSGLQGRRKSPTRLASGSSRAPASDISTSGQLVTTRSLRKSGRRTRGDKYSARFSQGG